MYRAYERLLLHHLSHLSQMAFLAGPRQVGKTTISQRLLEQQPGIYLNWDILADRERILAGPDTIMQPVLQQKQLGNDSPLIILDEIHKFKDWKNYLKGFYDQYKNIAKFIVTGSHRLDIYVKGGDSLMGRYFPYSIHPITVGELRHSQSEHHSSPTSDTIIQAPCPISDDQWQTLWQFGGFPDPFLQNTTQFYNQWQHVRHQQLFKEEIADLNKVSELAQLEVLASLLKTQVGSTINYNQMAKQVRASDQTIRRWLDVLESVYYCFRITPWFNNISRAIRKAPKVYLWDWSLVQEEGAKAENFIACHLLAAINLWNQTGAGQFGLHYLRNKEQNEVDFLISREQAPWILIEVKKSSKPSLSQQLYFFQQQTQASHAFQVALDAEYIDQNCFDHHDPIIVPAKTLLSQLAF